MSGHAKLSPSSASRWMACTRSPELEKQFPNTTSSFAEEGTLAHSICEDMLRLDHDQITKKEYDAKMAFHMSNKYYNSEMQEHCQDYVDFVNLSAFEKGAYIFIEQRLNMTNYIPEGFGTGDALVIRDRVLKFFDLKYGKGVKVSAVDNSQLKIYALGALNDYGFIFEVDMIELNIYQPRLGGVSSWSISVKDLLHWADTELKEKAAMAFNGEGEFKAGKHCHFCKAKAQCRALKDYNFELAAMAFKDPDLLNMEEIAEVLEKESLFTNWLTAVKAFVFDQAMSGVKIPGYKLVRGKSNRMYESPEKVEKVLLANKIKDIYTERKLLGLTALTTKIGKANFAKFVDPLIIKPEGAPTLVPADDKRDEISSSKEAADVFNDTGDLV